MNTDFAETEVAACQVNITRFPTFFPEKRTFFLEGADIFDYGLGLSADRDVLPLFSRRMGRDDLRTGDHTAAGFTPGRRAQ